MVRAGSVEADDEADLAQPRPQVFQICTEVGAAGLLARLQQDDRARMGAAARVQRFEGGRRRVGRVPVVARAAAVQPAAGDDGVHGPSPGDHSPAAGCLSRWP
ncbi:hypothetical protein GCM10009676_40610 [Prauserella halophila]|uniref:Uncharacterized protein n=1 Tax=Prauserella halophila TaxID=185641 RepID=A0ABP4H6B2_9PSEU